MASVTTCPSCGKRNRVPLAAGGRLRCAACHADLPWLVEAGDGDFDRAVAGPLPVLVDLWAPWCGPCKVLGPILEQLARDRAGRLKVVKVNVDESPSIPARYQVQSIPTLLLFDDGRLVDRQVGAAPAEALRRWLDGAATGR
jgi:thioredoxin 2